MKVTSSVLPIATTVSIVQAPCHRPLHDLIVDTIVKATQLRSLWLKGFLCVYVLGKSRERYHPCKKQQDNITTRPGNDKYNKPQSVLRTLRNKKQSDHLNAIELDSMPTQARFIRANNCAVSAQESLRDGSEQEAPKRPTARPQSHHISRDSRICPHGIPTWKH